MPEEIRDLKAEIAELIEEIDRADDRGVPTFGLRQQLKKKRETLAQLEEKYEQASSGEGR